MGITLSQYFGNSFIVTASKHLQDQYSDDYPILYPVKGKSNFPCLKIMKEKKIEDKILASTLQLTCEKGKCEEKKQGSTTKYCEYKPSIEKIDDGEEPVNMCDYYVQKYVALTSDHSLWNYSSFFQLMLNKKAFAKYIGKSVSIFDEAHKIEEQIINFIGIRITKRQLVQEGIPFRVTHKISGVLVQLAHNSKKPISKLTLAEIKKSVSDTKVDPKIVSKIISSTTVVSSLKDRKSFGSSGYDEQKRMISDRIQKINQYRSNVLERENKINSSLDDLTKQVNAII